MSSAIYASGRSFYPKESQHGDVTSVIGTCATLADLPQATFCRELLSRDPKKTQTIYLENPRERAGIQGSLTTGSSLHRSTERAVLIFILWTVQD